MTYLLQVLFGTPSAFQFVLFFLDMPTLQFKFNLLEVPMVNKELPEFVS